MAGRKKIDEKTDLGSARTPVLKKQNQNANVSRAETPSFSTSSEFRKPKDIGASKQNDYVKAATPSIEPPSISTPLLNQHKASDSNPLMAYYNKQQEDKEKEKQKNDELSEILGVAGQSGDPEDVARQIWNNAGVSNAEEYREASKEDLRVLGRSVAGGAAAAARNTINYAGYTAQNQAATNETENAYNKLIAGDKDTVAEADRIYADYLNGMTENERSAKEISGQLLPKEIVYYNAKLAENEEKHKDDKLQKVSSIGEKYQAETAQIKTSDKDLIKLGEGVGGMAPQVAAAILTQGASLAGSAGLATATKALSNIALLTSSAGAATQEALENGVSNDKAISYGTAIGAIELGTERISNGLGKFGKKAGLGGATDDLVQGIIDKYITDESGRQAASFIAGTIGEGFEEKVSEWAGYAANKLLAGYDQRTLGEVWKDSNDAFAMGATIAALFQGSQLALDKAKSRIQGERTNAGYSVYEPTEAETAEAVTQEDIESGVQQALDELVQQERNEQKSYTETANKILRNEQWLNDYVQQYGELQGKSNSEKAREIATNLRNADLAERTAEQPTQETTEQIQAEQPTEQTSTENVPSADEQFISDAINDISPSKANRIIASPTLRVIFTEKTGIRLDGLSKNQQREAILGVTDYLLAQDEESQNATETAQNVPTNQLTDLLTESQNAPTNDSVALNAEQNEEAREITDSIAQLEEELKTANGDDAYDIQQELSFLRGQLASIAPQGTLNNVEYNAPQSTAPQNAVTEQSTQNVLTQQLDESMTANTENALSQQTEEPDPRDLGADTNNPNSFSAMQNQADSFHPINEQAAQITMQERGRAPVEVPTVNFEGRMTSKTVETLANANITTNEVVTVLEKDLADGKFSRIPYSDAEAVGKAEAHITDVGWDAAVAEYQAAVNKGTSSKDVMALGITLYNNAVNAGDVVGAVNIASLMAENARTTAQGLQVMNLINKLSPEGKLYAAVRSLENIKSELNAKYGDRFDGDIDFDQDLLNNYYESLKTGTEAEQRDAMKALMRDIGTKVPNTFNDVFNAMRYLAMLGNFRTQVRNVVGNAGFAAVRQIKNLTQTGLERALLSDGQRNTTMLTSADASLVADCDADFENARAAIMSGGKWQDTTARDDISEGQRSVIFLNKSIQEKADSGNNGAKAVNALLRGVQGYSNAVNWTMDKGDIVFSRAVYAKTLARYLKAKGYSSLSQLSETELAKAREWAVQESAEATYRDTSQFAEVITGLSNAIKTKANNGNVPAKIVNVVFEGVFAFKKTPANILARAYEYSPINAAVQAVNTAKGKANLSKADAAAQAEIVTQLNNSINGLAKGVTGTALIGVGMLLAKLGLLVGKKDDDEKQAAFDTLQGKQSYAFYIPSLDINVTADWLAPEVIPMFIGANIYQSMENDGLTFVETLNSLNGISEPLVEMSMLSGLQDFLDTGTYTQNATIWDYAVTGATSFISQVLPTIGGQIERGLDDNRKETYRYNDDVSNALTSNAQRIIGNAMNKTPGDFQEIDFIDEWGRTQDYGNGNLLYQMLSPGYISRERTSNVEAQLQSLYDEGFTSVFPSKRGQSEQIQIHDADGNVIEQRHLTAEEYQRFNTLAGQTRFGLIESAVNSAEWNDMTSEQKADMISDIYALANLKATLEVDSNAKASDFQKAALESDNPISLIRTYNVFSDKESSGEDINSAVTAYSSMSDEDKKVIEDKASYVDEMEKANGYGVQPADYSTVYKATNINDDFTDADWQNLETALGKYNEMPKEVQEMINESHSGTAKMAEAYSLGVSPKEYNANKNGIKITDEMTDADWGKVDSSVSWLASQNEDVQELFGGAKLVEAHNIGINAKDYTELSTALKHDTKNPSDYAAMDSAVSRLSNMDRKTIEFFGAEGLVDAHRLGIGSQKYYGIRDGLDFKSGEKYSDADYARIDKAVQEYMSLTDEQKEVVGYGVSHVTALTKASRYNVGAKDYFKVGEVIADYEYENGRYDNLKGAEKMEIVAKTATGKNADDVMRAYIYIIGDSDTSVERYDIMRKLGFSNNQYAAIRTVANSYTKKDEIIPAIMERFNTSEATATSIYYLIKGDTKGRAYTKLKKQAGM